MEQRPLAERMRPQRLEEFIGQSHLIGMDAPLSKLLDSEIIPSIIFWGPPGVGKTTLARLIATELDRPMYMLSAVSSGVKDVREVLDKARKRGLFGTSSPILFIDEIHRFSKSQQDSLLGAVEEGVVTLIGATTENPSFEVISALLSRTQVYVLNHLGEEDMKLMVNRALESDDLLAKKKVTIKEWGALMRLAGGDGRKLLNILELCCREKGSVTLTDDLVQSSVQENVALYDKNGELHYDLISAFIKSMRGSDPNAAMYYLVRMTQGGEDPKFIARRLVILASEDIGLANPTALVIANACFEAVHKIGYPECEYALAETVLYLAASPKSNSALVALQRAKAAVRDNPNAPVPLHLRNAPTELMSKLGYGKGYQYPHNDPQNFSEEEYLPEEVSNKSIYTPGLNEREAALKNRLEKLWKGRYSFD